MSNLGDQNGRQPPLPVQPRPPSEPQPETENTKSSDQPKQICRNYVWGTCTKNTKCKFRHELDLEEMKKILKFCHDYQNKSNCTREDCTYLHTTREEENLFLTTGQIPRVLAERHAAMSASINNEETIPQIAKFIRESYVPYPPVVTPTTHVGAPTPPSMPPPTFRPAPPATPALVMPMLPSIPMMPPPPMQQLPPPPPPPPPPSPSPPTVPSTVSNAAVPVYTAPLPPPPETTVVFSMNQPPPPLPVMFDASRPPPPLPNQIKANNGTEKRKIQNLSEAGPSKIRKPEDTNLADAHCENCVQRVIRIDFYMQEMEKLHCEEEHQTLLYKKTLEGYETAKELLRSFVSEDLFRILEKEIEGVPQIQLPSIISELNSTPFDTGMSTVPKQFLLNLLECVYRSSSMVNTVPNTSNNLYETLLQSLSVRRSNSVINHSPSDDIQAFVNLLENSGLTLEKTLSSSEMSRIGNTRGSSVGVNGFNGCTTSQKTDNSAASISLAGTVTYSSSNAPPRPYPIVSTVVASTSGTQLTAPLPPYPSYQPNIPPPPPIGPVFNMFQASNNQNIPYNATNRASAPVTQPTTSRSSTMAAFPVHPDNSMSNQFMMGRFPPPHYNTPYQ